MQGSGLDAELPSARLVGRFFKRHLLTAVLAFSAVRKTDRLRKTLLWMNDSFPHSSVQPLGFGPDALAALLPRCVPKVLARFLCRFAYGFFLQTEDGSSLNNRVVARNERHPLPTLDYEPARLPAAQCEHKDMVKHFCAVLRRAGYIGVSKTIPSTGTAHACGTLICGRDPGGSVVDGYGRVHGFDNLSVLDGSVLPRSSRVNPALTIYAFALRAAEHLIGTEAGRD
jgi:choline dehydrogenase-like flavoprotein